MFSFCSDDPGKGGRRLVRLSRSRAVYHALPSGNRPARPAAQDVRAGAADRRLPQSRRRRDRGAGGVGREAHARGHPGVVAIQVSRLNEAMLVAFSAMTGANLKAVDRVVKIVRELDRYHGLVAAQRRLPEPSRTDAPAEGTMTFGAALVRRPEIALQDFEKIGFAPGLAMSSQASVITSSDLVLSLSKEASSNVSARSSMLRDATLCAAPQHEGEEVRPAASTGDDRPGIPAEAFEKIEIRARGYRANPEDAWPPRPASAGRGLAPGLGPGEGLGELAAAASRPAPHPNLLPAKGVDRTPVSRRAMRGEGTLGGCRPPANPAARP